MPERAGRSRSPLPGEGRDASEPPAPPHRVRVPVNVHDWQRISFLHWPVDPATLAGLVPEELAVLTFEVLRMEVTQAWFVATLRALGLPYFRQRMSVDVADTTITYAAEARDGDGQSHRVVVRPGAPLEPPTGDEHARFLTARWGAYHRRGPLLFYTPADHPPWPLHTVDVDTYDVEGFVRSAGLPPLEGPPLAHYSPGVTVKIGRPERAG